MQPRAEYCWVETSESRSGLRVTGPVAAQLRVGSDHRDGGPDGPCVRRVASVQDSVILGCMTNLHSRAVVGWLMQSHMPSGLVKDVLPMARCRRRPDKGLVFQNDRGSQYCSEEFRTTSKAGWGVSSSMSRRGNRWDNALTESFSGT